MPKQKTREEIEQRVEELAEKDEAGTITEREQEELADLEAMLEDLDGEPEDEQDEDGEESTEEMVRVSPQITSTLYSRLKAAAKREHMSVSAYMARAAEQHANGNGNGTTPASANQDLIALCELRRLYDAETNPHIKAKIAARVKRQYGISLSPAPQMRSEEQDDLVELLNALEQKQPAKKGKAS